jgi:glycerol-3-phosphate O-acyltransferase
MKAGSSILRWLLSLWVRVTILPNEDDTLGALKGKTVCYVMQDDALTKQVVLEQTCSAQGLPLPSEGVHLAELDENYACFVLNNTKRNIANASPARLKRMIEALQEGDGSEALIVPVSIFWGRGPRNTGGFLQVCLAMMGLNQIFSQVSYLLFLTGDALLFVTVNLFRYKNLLIKNKQVLIYREN